MCAAMLPLILTRFHSVRGADRDVFGQSTRFMAPAAWKAVLPSGRTRTGCGRFAGQMGSELVEFA